ncbi:MAG: hypothetical protein M3N53_15230, partial [Actinomycetota bacterium]|nr:hypothetical protein [Actinomycetota bacterium]
PQPEPTEPQPEPTEPQPEPTEPQPEPTEPATHLRAVDLRLSRHLIARGRVHAGEAEMCSSGVAVSLERRASSGWVRLRTKTTRDDGSFRFDLRDRPGRYRSVVDEVAGGEGDGRYICGAAASAPVSHRHR